MVAGFPLTETTDIQRHFVMVGNRAVHYLRAGEGPCVVLLHGSPESSLALISLINILKDRFTVIVLDNPGCGNSDPLEAEQPDIPDYADALRDTLDALDITTCAIYGFHTGAAIGGHFTRHHPERVSLFIANGYPIFTKDERDDILENYLTPFVPSWDGAHVAWAWARFQEQVTFFPWHATDRAHRMNRTYYPADYTQFACLQLFRAGDAYRASYHAAFAYEGEHLLPDFTSPVVISAMGVDPLMAHLDRLDNLSDSVRVIPMQGTVPEAYEAYGHLLEKYPAAPPPPAPKAAPGQNGVVQDFISAGGGQVYVQYRHGEGRPLILLHGPADSSRQFDSLLQSSQTARPLYAFDLPGNGESDNTYTDGVMTTKAAAEKVAACLDTLGLADADILGLYGGATIAIELAQLRPQQIQALKLIGVADYTDEQRQDLLDNYTPDLTPTWDGTHLITAWRMLRLQGLFWPWHHMSAESIIWDEPDVDVDDLQVRFVDLMKCASTYHNNYRAEFTYDVVANLKNVSIPVTIGLWKRDPMRHAAQEVADACGFATIDLPREMKMWAL